MDSVYPNLDIFPLDDVIADKSFEHLTVEDVDNRIVEHAAQIVKLRALIVKHQRAIAKYKGHRNTLTDTITSKLPVEIFSDILLHYASMCRDPKESPRGERYYLWVKLLHICRRWRNIACSTPTLFSHVPVRIRQHHDVDLARDFLRLSGQTALHLETELYDNKESRETLLLLLSDHAHRVATMCSNAYPMVEIYHGMNSLRSMTMRPNHPYESWSGSFLKYPLPLSLTRLKFYNIFPIASPQEFLSAVGELSRLQELQIVSPQLPSNWDHPPHTTKTIGPLKTVLLAGCPRDIPRLLRHLTVSAEGGLCISVGAAPIDDLWDVLHQVGEKLFSTPSSLDVVHSMRLATSHLGNGSFEYSIGSQESIGQKSIISGKRGIIADLDDPPMVYPKFHIYLNTLECNHGLFALYVMEMIESAFPAALSVTSRFVVDLHQLSRSVVKSLLEKSANLTTLELFCRWDFSRVVKAIRGWFVDTSGASSEAFPLLHTLIITYTFDESEVATIGAILSLHDVLKIRKESGLPIRTLVVDFSTSRVGAVGDFRPLIEELRDVVSELSYLPPRHV